MDDSTGDFFTFRKGEFRTRSLEEVLGKGPEKVVRNEYEQIEELLTLRRKMAELAHAIARRLEKPSEARELEALDRQIRQLQRHFESLKQMDQTL
jgi:hypothetical protein